MKAYILAICGAVILSALVGLLVSENRMGKFINGLLKIVCLLVMVLPLPDLIQSVTNGSWKTEIEVNSLYRPDERYIAQTFSARARLQEAETERIAEREFGVSADVEIVWKSVEYSYQVQKVLVKIQNFGINDDDSHIVIIEQIKNRVSQLFVGAEVVVSE